jgi:chromosome segregation ATPase
MTKQERDELRKLLDDKRGWEVRRHEVVSLLDDLDAKDAEIARWQNNADCANMQVADLKAEIARLQAALDQAASSLDALKYAGRECNGLDTFEDIRAYSKSRASVAREALEKKE